MPLVKGTSNKAVSTNIKRIVKEGKTVRQAVGEAEGIKDQAMKKTGNKK